MKKIAIILSSIAAAVLFAAGCNQEPMTGADLDNLKADRTYVAIDTLGGSADINLTATESWKVMVHTSYEWTDADKKKHTVDTLITPGTSCNPRGIKDPVASWITVSPMEGSAGTGKITISAPASDSYRTEEVRIVGQTKTLNVIVAQGEDIPKTYTTSEAVALIRAGKQSGSPVIVTGIVCKIDEISTSYGNATYYISDDGTFTGDKSDGNWLEIYRGYWLDGEKFTKGDELAIGDKVTIKAVLIDYQGTPETLSGNCEVVSIEKSLVAVSPSEFSLPADENNIRIAVLYSGDKLNFELDEDATKFLSITGTEEVEDTTFFKVYVQENNAPDARKGVITFSSTSGKDKSVAGVTVIQAGRKGQTPDNPFTVEEAIAAIDAGTASGNYYVKGIISQVDKINPGDGNAQYWISDDGTTDNQMEVYRGLSFGGKPFVEGDVLGEGWEVVVYGPLTKYKTTYELNANNHIYSIEGATGIFTPTEAKEYVDSEGYDASRLIIVKGVINTVSISLSYGNAEVWVSEDGSEKSFEFYRNFWFGGDHYTSADQIKAGDAVMAVGKVKKYNTTYELDASNYMIWVNGKSKAE